MFQSNAQHAIEYQELLAQRPGSPLANTFQNDRLIQDVAASPHREMIDGRLLLFEMRCDARHDVEACDGDELKCVSQLKTRQMLRPILYVVRCGL
ncbi:hypothetical protein FAZ69_13660 [Trinickia terrae]|uniref:Uncharacterized protein n=1 Tax=Trinickia terrae TaxID=2571161 RepID=A0A4U1I694_9BURK|nr:hypothetical protein [Trinickia terrae]TKC88787.1 hypothetical protein FAZ69_13660 [Trinickia terrae]